MYQGMQQHDKQTITKLIYGNGPRETIGDCSANGFCESACAAIGEPI